METSSSNTLCPIDTPLPQKPADSKQSPSFSSNATQTLPSQQQALFSIPELAPEAISALPFSQFAYQIVAQHAYHKKCKRSPLKRPRKVIPPKESSIHFIPGEENIHSFEEIPRICHFFWIFQDLLKMTPFNPKQLEKAILDPNSSLMTQILSRIVIGPNDHYLLKKNESFPRHIVHQILALRVKTWYLQHPERPVEAAKALHSIGTTNPLESASFDALSVSQRVRILYLLCEELSPSDGKFWHHVRKIVSSDLREDPFAIDCTGAKYYYFGLVDDFYIYREVPLEGGQKPYSFGLVCDSYEGIDRLVAMLDQSKPESNDCIVQLNALKEMIEPEIQEESSEEEEDEELIRSYNFRKRSFSAAQEEEVPKIFLLLERMKMKVEKLSGHNQIETEESDTLSDGEEDGEEEEEEDNEDLLSNQNKIV